MERNTAIKFVKKVDVTDLSGEKVIVDFESGKYFLIKGTAGDIWNLLKDGITVQEIIDQLLQMYDVEEEFCAEQVIYFLEKLVNLEFIKEM